MSLLNELSFLLLILALILLHLTLEFNDVAGKLSVLYLDLHVVLLRLFLKVLLVREKFLLQELLLLRMKMNLRFLLLCQSIELFLQRVVLILDLADLQCPD